MSDRWCIRCGTEIPTGTNHTSPCALEPEDVCRCGDPAFDHDGGKPDPNGHCMIADCNCQTFNRDTRGRWPHEKAAPPEGRAAEQDS